MSETVKIQNADGTVGQVYVDSTGAVKAGPSPSILASGTNGSGGSYTTTSSYSSAINGPIVNSRPYTSISIHVKENNVNAIMYQVVGYLEASGFLRPIILASAQAVPKGGDNSPGFIITMGLIAIDVQCVDSVGGSHGQAIIDVAAV